VKPAAKCARADFKSKWQRPSHRPPRGRPTLLLRVFIFYALGGERRESADEEKLRGLVTNTSSHTHTIASAQLNEIPGEEISEKYRGPARAKHKIVCNTEANIIAHAWLAP
jgi:hypothetical protein